MRLRLYSRLRQEHGKGEVGPRANVLFFGGIQFRVPLANGHNRQADAADGENAAVAAVLADGIAAGLGRRMAVRSAKIAAGVNVTGAVERLVEQDA